MYARGNQFLGFRRPTSEPERGGRKKGDVIWKSSRTVDPRIYRRTTDPSIDLTRVRFPPRWKTTVQLAKAREGAAQSHGHGFPYYTSRTCNEIPRQIKVEDGYRNSSHASRSFYLCRTKKTIRSRFRAVNARHVYIYTRFVTRGDKFGVTKTRGIR